MLGLARAEGTAPEGWTGEMYTPVGLTDDERALCTAAYPDLMRADRLDCPAWLLPLFDAALGEQTDATLAMMQQRAPVFARVNIAKGSLNGAVAELAVDGIKAQPHPLAVTALEITQNPRRLRISAAYTEGRVELQDVASQAVALDFLRHVASGTEVLDYCAGGGGKALAMAAQGVPVAAYDIAPARMRDLPARVARAGADVRLLGDAPSGVWGAVFADAPCSGSGSWRRAPEAKWAFSPERLAELTAIQGSILVTCADLVGSSGVLGYATCSMLRAENEDRIEAFLAGNPGWKVVFQQRLGPLDGGDGFFLSVLRRE